MALPVFSKQWLDFLKEIRENNNREWFAKNKPRYTEIYKSVKEFYGDVESLLNEHDVIEKTKVFRIYRDVRFSKDKTPYQTHWAGGFTRAEASRRGGYYVRIKPGETCIATGFWAPNKEDILRIRKEFTLDDREIREIMNETLFKQVWGSMTGNVLKTAPKGFDKEHKAIDLIRKKQFVFSKSYTDKEVLSKRFAQAVSNDFQVVRPYLDYMTSILTTDLNGVSLL